MKNSSIFLPCACILLIHGRRCWNSFVFAEVMMMTWWHPLNVTFTRTVYDSDFSRILWYDFINKIWPNYSMDKWNESCVFYLLHILTITDIIYLRFIRTYQSYVKYRAILLVYYLIAYFSPSSSFTRLHFCAFRHFSVFARIIQPPTFIAII